MDFFQSTLDTEGAKIQIYSEILCMYMKLELSKSRQALDLHSNVSTRMNLGDR